MEIERWTDLLRAAPKMSAPLTPVGIAAIGIGGEAPRASAVTATAPTAESVVATLDRDDLTEYEAVAKELGFAPSALAVERFTAFLAEECIPVYDRQKVAAYLDQELGKPTPPTAYQLQSARWCWRPMRGADRNGALAPIEQNLSLQMIQQQALQMLNQFPGMGAQSSSALTQNNMLGRHLTPYQKAIPLPVLLTAKKIVAAFKDAKLFVSDLVAEHEKPRNPDPFLLVEYAGQTWIVEKWDEPKFRS